MTSVGVVRLSEHVDSALQKYRFRIPVIVAALFGLLFGIGSLLLIARTNSNMLRAISPHVSTLVESLDRPELQRLVSSMGSAQRAKVIVVENGTVLASSESLSELDTPYVPAKSITFLPGTALSADGFITNVDVRRTNGPSDLNAQIVMIASIRAVLGTCILVAVVLFSGAIIVSQTFFDRLKRTLDLALSPVAELDLAIRNLKSFPNSTNVPTTGIVELESISTAIRETRQDLIEARDAIALSKAKDLAADAYKRLIHDLHTPIAALRNIVALTNTATYDTETNQEAAKLIPEIADQILMQVTAAKSNLEFESPVLESVDIGQCLRSVLEIVRQSNQRGTQVHFVEQMPGAPVWAQLSPVLMRRALGNLLGNAVDACLSEVRVSLETQENQIKILIEDDGPGIAPEVVSLHLQGRGRSTKQNRQGFGLSAANHIVRSHGGRIIHKTGSKGGACFEVRLG